MSTAPQTVQQVSAAFARGDINAFVDLRDEEMDRWNVNAACKVTRLRHCADTARHIAAAR